MRNQFLLENHQALIKRGQGGHGPGLTTDIEQ